MTILESISTVPAIALTLLGLATTVVVLLYKRRRPRFEKFCEEEQHGSHIETPDKINPSHKHTKLPHFVGTDLPDELCDKHSVLDVSSTVETSHSVNQPPKHTKLPRYLTVDSESEKQVFAGEWAHGIQGQTVVIDRVSEQRVRGERVLHTDHEFSKPVLARVFDASPWSKFGISRVYCTMEILDAHAHGLKNGNVQWTCQVDIGTTLELRFFRARDAARALTPDRVKSEIQAAGLHDVADRYFTTEPTLLSFLIGTTSEVEARLNRHKLPVSLSVSTARDIEAGTLKKADVAKQLGTRPSTLTRRINLMRTAGLLET